MDSDERAAVDEQPLAPNETRARPGRAKREAVAVLPVQAGKSAALAALFSVETEAKIGGAIHRLRWKDGTNPADVPDLVRLLDPVAKFREEFSGGGFKQRGPAIPGVAQSIKVDVRDGSKFVEIQCKTAEKAIAASVSKRNVDEWFPKLKALGKLADDDLAEIESVWNDKGSALVMLEREQRFGVMLSEFSGRHFVDDMTVDPPEIKKGATT